MTKAKRLLLCGANGKMGRVITACIARRDEFEIAAGVDRNPERSGGFPMYSSLSEFGGEVDVILDFSHPALLSSILEYAVRTVTPLVVATTGYSEEQLGEIREAARTIPVFFTFNMSLGVNLLLDLAKRAEKALGNQFDIEIIEKHHNQKVDSPSGTAIMLAEALNEAAGGRYGYEYDRHSKRQKRSPNEIGIHSVRGGTIVGEHEVIFAGRDEVLTLSHTAMSKEIFAVGAVNAVEFLLGKPPGLYSMADLLSEP